MLQVREDFCGSLSQFLLTLLNLGVTSLQKCPEPQAWIESLLSQHPTYQQGPFLSLYLPAAQALSDSSPFF